MLMLMLPLEKKLYTQYATVLWMWKSNRVEGLVAAFENNSYLLLCGGKKNIFDGLDNVLAENCQ